MAQTRPMPKPLQAVLVALLAIFCIVVAGVAANDPEISQINLKLKAPEQRAWECPASMSPGTGYEVTIIASSTGCAAQLISGDELAPYRGSKEYQDARALRSSGPVLFEVAAFHGELVESSPLVRRFVIIN